MQSRHCLRSLWACLIVPLAFAITPCRADSHALVIGIDDYKQTDRINSLGGATNDAHALAKTLEDVAAIPAANVRTLVSGADPEPTTVNILAEVDRLAKRVKPGDTAWVLFSGHGIEIDGVSFLVPWDADAHTEETLKDTALPTAVLRDHLARIPAKTLILSFDMCRTDPRKGSRDLSSNNLLGANQARDLTLVPAKDASGPQDIVTLYACSEGERSWEWTDKHRGFFSWYLEQGLRHDAADNQGVVRVNNLVSYVKKAVYGAVQREEGESQTPFPAVEGKDAPNVILARGLAPSAGGATAVVKADPTPQGQYDASLQQGYEAQQANQPVQAQAKFQTALSVQPESAQAANGLGHAYLTQNKLDKAEESFRQAVQLDPKNANYADDLGVVLFNRRNNAEAEKSFQQAIALDATDPAPVKHLAILYRANKRDSDAEPLLLKAMDINPKDAEAPDMLGDIYMGRKDYGAAEAKYQRAVRLDSGNGKYLSHLATCMVKEGKIGEAHQIADKARGMGFPVPNSIFDKIPGIPGLPKIHIGGFHL
ncbi:MAG: caspase family protein [Armatimonadota bacterium]|nr:caspase family protein [Armatimonadota bacterium]